MCHFSSRPLMIENKKYPQTIVKIYYRLVTITCSPTGIDSRIIAISIVHKCPSELLTLLNQFCTNFFFSFDNSNAKLAN